MITTYPDQKFYWIRETVRMQFDFLLQQGYQVISVMFTDHGIENWQVMTLRSGKGQPGVIHDETC